MDFKHVSVLLDECIEGLDIKENGIYVDGTMGGAGHSSEIIKKLSKDGLLIGIDQDTNALKASKERLKDYDNVKYVHSNFSNIKNVLKDLKIEKVDGILLDLGVSSHQLDVAERGFSYMNDAPLDMRMNRENDFSARNIINEYSKYKIVFFCATNNIFTKFKLIKNNNICYINNIIYEDVFFGIALVLNKANKIYQTNKKLYNYRVRPNSITTTTNINNINLLSTQTRQEYCKFKTKNLNEAKELFNAACMSITAIKTIEYLNKNPRNKDAIIGQFMRWLCSFIPKYLESKNDPYCLISKFDILKPYISTCHYHTKLAIKYPMQYRLFAKQISKIIQMARFIKRKLKH